MEKLTEKDKDRVWLSLSEFSRLLSKAGISEFTHSIEKTPTGTFGKVTHDYNEDNQQVDMNIINKIRDFTQQF